MFVDNLFSKINVSKSHRYLYLTPCVYTVGNCSTEILCGIISAKSRGKKLFILYPYNIPFIFKWNITNSRLFLLESEYIVKQNKYIRSIVKLFVTIVYVPIRIYALIVRDYFGKNIDESISIPRIGEQEIFTPITPIYEGEIYNYSLIEKYVSEWWEKEGIGDISVIHSYQAELESIDNLKRSLGMLESDWYVCLHVRESGFRSDKGRRDYRNSNINNYIKAISEITSRGGWVIRMGDNTMLRLPKMERVVDYPFTRYKSDLNDLLLIKYCFFYLGTQSGILDVANLFLKNVLLTNMVHWGAAGLHGTSGRGILKHWYCKDRKKYISFEELFSTGEGFVCYEHSIWDSDTDAKIWDNIHKISASMENYILVDNNEDEINDAVIEYIDLLRSGTYAPTHLQDLVVKYRNRCIHELLCGDGIYMFDTDRRNRLNNYYFSLRTRVSTGLICNNFLSKNWTHNSRNSS